MADPQPPAKPPAAADPKPQPPAKPAKTRVRALARGYYDGVIRERGDEFEIEADADLGGWMDPVSEAEAKRLAPEIAKLKKNRPPPPIGPNVKPTPATRLK